MTEKCELLETCGFFKKYQESWSVACKNLISKYCMGPNMAECRRKEYRSKHGVSPDPDMMPTGDMLKG
jgi:hypothetical protein